MAIKRLIFLILGLICLALGTAGVFLPVLPTVPFCIWIPCIILAAVWICHIVYFVFGVKTIKEENSEQ